MSPLRRSPPPKRPGLWARLRGRAAPAAPGSDEQRSRAVMSELCPHGWRADITLFAHRDHEDGEHPPRPDAVRLTWTELHDELGTPAVMRELWAPTVDEALRRMVADRRTDETLESIERAAVLDADWPELD